VRDDLTAVAAKVALLRLPASYPEGTAGVEVVETHMSWVFLTDRHAYKLKKPVCYDHLNFSSLAARQYYCEEEVRLNRRLAASVYLGVVRLAEDADGTLRLGGAGKVVDWLVKMVRLPADRMLDSAIMHGAAGPEDARRIAQHLGGFYVDLLPAPVAADAYRRRLRREIDEYERELCNPEFALPAGEVRAICQAQRAVLEQHAALFDRRVGAGRVVEGHGDLRPEHVCLGPPLVIIDCLEFSPEFRTQDTADELGFLALECERLGAPDFGRLLIDTYGDITGDRPEAGLVHFYQSYRACVRAKISIWHLLEARFRDSPKWPDRARHYLQLAQRHIDACSGALQAENMDTTTVSGDPTAGPLLEPPVKAPAAR
jgi:aminoglycoside phosphotransferase family enzyme